MAKITLNPISGSYASVTSLNALMQQIEDAFNDDVLYRTAYTGEANAMALQLDMGSNKIINLAAPLNNSDGARLQDVLDAASPTTSSAVLTSISDAGGYFETANVEGAIAENSQYSEYGIDSGAANAYVVAVNPIPTAYKAGMNIQFKPLNDNTGASTINLNGIGAKNIKLNDGTDPSAGAIDATGLVSLQYDGTSFILRGVGDVTKVGTQTLTDKTIAAGSYTGTQTGFVGDVTGDLTGNADTATSLASLTATVAELNKLDTSSHQKTAWTPVLGVTGATTGILDGYYYRVGNIVTIAFRIGALRRGTWSTGTLQITNLPYAVSGLSHAPLSLYYGFIGAVTADANLWGQFVDTTTVLTFQFATPTGTTLGSLTNTTVPTATTYAYIYASMSYYTDDAY